MMALSLRLRRACAGANLPAKAANWSIKALRNLRTISSVTWSCGVDQIGLELNIGFAAHNVQAQIAEHGAQMLLGDGR